MNKTFMTLTLGLVLAIFPMIRTYAQNTIDFSFSSACEGSQMFFLDNSVITSGIIIEYNWDLDNDGVTDSTGASTTYLFSGSGTFTVNYQVILDNGDTLDISRDVDVYPIPSADFTVQDACHGSPNIFTDNSTVSSGAIVNQEWDLDNDGIYGGLSGPEVFFTFPDPGSFVAGMRVTTDQGCSSVIDKTFSVFPNPTVDYVFENQCLGDNTVFTANAQVTTGAIATYEWDFDGDLDYGDGTGEEIEHLFIAAGNHQTGITATTDEGCTATSNMIVPIYQFPYIHFDVVGACTDTEVNFENNSFSPVGSIDYSWNFGDNVTSSDVDPTHVYSDPGTYQVSLVGQSSFGCVDSTSVEIEIFSQPDANFSATNVCIGGTSSFSNLTNDNGAAIETYFWDFDDNQVSVAENPSHHYDQPGTYNVTLAVTTIDGCRDTLAWDVEVFTLPSAEIRAEGPTEFCIGDSVELVTQAVLPGSFIFWSTGVYGSTTTTGEPGDVVLLVVDANGCEDRDTIEITVYDLPVLEVNNDTTVSLGYEADLWVTGAQFYDWTPAASLDISTSDRPTALPLETTTYSVTGEDENGCVNTEEVTITVDRDYNFLITNLFTPNGDGTNDRWYIKGIEYYDDCEVVVYNRWGNEVFASTSYHSEWDGTRNGNNLPAGTYYYILKCDGIESIFQGPITLLRLLK